MCGQTVAISDNKEYVDELAIDSHLSEGISIEEIFCKDLVDQNDAAMDPGQSATYLHSEQSLF